MTSLTKKQSSIVGFSKVSYHDWSWHGLSLAKLAQRLAKEQTAGERGDSAGASAATGAICRVQLRQGPPKHLVNPDGRLARLIQRFFRLLAVHRVQRLFPQVPDAIHKNEKKRRKMRTLFFE